MDKLDSDPERVRVELAEFLYLCVAYWNLQGLDPDEKFDVATALWEFYERNRFAKLREYRDQGSPMSVWCHWKAAMEAKDTVRKRLRYQTHFVSTSFQPEPEEEDAPTIPPPVDPRPDAHKRLEHSELETLYLECVSELSEHERAWFELDAEDRRPREIVALLGMDSTDNAKVSNGIGHARTLLIQCLDRKLKALGSSLKDYGSRVKRRRVEGRPSEHRTTD